MTHHTADRALANLRFLEDRVPMLDGWLPITRNIPLSKTYFYSGFVSKYRLSKFMMVDNHFCQLTVPVIDYHKWPELGEDSIWIPIYFSQAYISQYYWLVKSPFNPHHHPYNKYSLVISVISQENSSWKVAVLDGQINSWCYSKKHFVRLMNPHEIQWQFFPINSPFVTNLDGQIRLIFMLNPHFDPENGIPIKYPLNTHKFPFFPYNFLINFIPPSIPWLLHRLNSRCHSSGDPPRRAFGAIRQQQHRRAGGLNGPGEIPLGFRMF